jgi:Ca2+/H+ antiporter, TMEM165/GDT1 family
MDWKLFASTFALIFIAELPDKTFIATLLMSTRHNPWGVFAGAAGAFVVQSLIAVAFGSVISLLPTKIVHAAAGLLFLVFAVLMWREKEEEEAVTAVEKDDSAKVASLWKVMGTSFTVIFLAEWGDLTQLATATLAAQYRAPVTIFASATLALWSVTALGALAGHGAKRLLDPELIQKVGAVIFGLVGIFLLIRLK